MDGKPFNAHNNLLKYFLLSPCYKRKLRLREGHDLPKGNNLVTHIPAGLTLEPKSPPYPGCLPNSHDTFFLLSTYCGLDPGTSISLTSSFNSQNSLMREVVQLSPVRGRDSAAQ